MTTDQGSWKFRNLAKGIGDDALVEQWEVYAATVQLLDPYALAVVLDGITDDRNEAAHLKGKLWPAILHAREIVTQYPGLQKHCRKEITALNSADAMWAAFDLVSLISTMTTS